MQQHHVLDIPFTYREVASKFGARWNPAFRVTTWYGEKSKLPLPLTGFEAPLFSWQKHVEQQMNKQKEPVREPTKLIELRDHQRQAMMRIAMAYKSGYPGFLLADEVGLGKTITAWASILALGKGKSLRIGIVAPLSVLPGWRNTIEWMGNEGHTVIVINYDKLRVFYDETKADKAASLKGVSKYAKPREFDVLVWDECHYLKNLDAARTKLALNLYGSSGFNLWLSATAGQNPLELGYLLPLLTHLTPQLDSTGSTALKKFEAWCKAYDLNVKRGKFGKWDWDNSLDDCKRLHNLLYKPNPPKHMIPAGIRRRPEDIAGWPSLQRILFPVDLEAEATQMYQLHWQEFLLAIRDIPRSPNRKVALENGLAALTRFRMKASLLRVDSTVDHALSLLEDNHKVAIFCEFKGTVKAISEALTKEKIKHSIITGENPDPSHRENQRLEFQKGDSEVILFSVPAGINLQEGELISGDKPRAQIDHDINWSALKMHQADGRCHRNGKFAKVYWSFANSTKEIRVIELLFRKLQSMNAISGDSLSAVTELEELFEAVSKE